MEKLEDNVFVSFSAIGIEERLDIFILLYSYIFAPLFLFSACMCACCAPASVSLFLQVLITHPKKEEAIFSLFQALF